MATKSKTTSATNACDSVTSPLSPEKREAWLGFLQAHSVVTKALEANLVANFGLQISGFEVLSQLDAADAGRMRMSDLAFGAMLSQSRVSRLVTELERGGLTERQSCPTDSRVVWAAITPAGRDLLQRVQEEHHTAIEETFFDGLTQAEVKQLAKLWPRVIATAAPSK